MLKNTNITQHLNLEVEFPCQLRLSRYPFGRYMCNLTFEHTTPNIKWASVFHRGRDYYGIEYRKDKDLLDFSLENVTLLVHDSDTMLTLTLHLAAQPDYHITNSLLPSSLMFFICYLSLFFPTACFNERIMVSLTALLVLVTLFSQATNSYVRTPYYKLIDVWHVVLIILSFAVVVANALVNCLHVSRMKPQTDPMKEVLAAKRCNIACQVLIASCFVTLIVIFVLFSADIL